MTDQELGIDTLIVNDKVKLIAFEMAGRAHATWHHFYGTASIVLFVIDVMEMGRIDKIRNIIMEMDEELPERAKIVLAFNKIDLVFKEESKPDDHECSHVTEFVNVNRSEFKTINQLRFDDLNHEVQTCKCSGKSGIGISNLVKIIYELAMREVYGNLPD